MNSTVSCQTSLDSNTVFCYTAKEVKQIIKKIKRAETCDSITVYQDKVIMRGDSILKTSNERYNKLNTLALSYQKQRDKDRKKLILFKRFQLIGIPVFLGGGLYLGYVLAR